MQAGEEAEAVEEEAADRLQAAVAEEEVVVEGLRRRQ